jgi:hypothetical protein
MALEIVGGQGSDTFNVGGSGGNAITVVSNDLQGHSGLILNTVSSTDAAYQAIFVRDVSAHVADNDAAGVAVAPVVGPLRVFEGIGEGALVVNSYRVVLTRAPEENVVVTAAPVALRESVLAAGGRGIWLATADNVALASQDGVALQFTRNNWYVPQTVYVFAPQDTVAEGNNGLNIVHRVQQGASPKDGGAYDGLAVPGVVVMVIDDDAASVVIATYDNDALANPRQPAPIVAEGAASGAQMAPAILREDSYWVVLSKQPTGTVRVDLAFDAQTTLAAVDGAVQTGNSLTLTFNAGNWNTARKITVKAVDDSAREGTHYSRITHTIRALETDGSKAADADNFLGITVQGVAEGIANGVNGDLGSKFDATVGSASVTLTGPAFNAALLTPYTGTVVTLAGTPLAGETWALTLNGKAYGVTVQLGETLDAIAARLAAAIDAVTGIDASASGAAIDVNLTSSVVFTLGFAASGSSSGRATIAPTTQLGITQGAGSERAWDLAQIALTDPGATAAAGRCGVVSAPQWCCLRVHPQARHRQWKPGRTRQDRRRAGRCNRSAWRELCGALRHGNRQALGYTVQGRPLDPLGGRRYRQVPGGARGLAAHRGAAPFRWRARAAGCGSGRQVQRHQSGHADGQRIHVHPPLDRQLRLRRGVRGGCRHHRDQPAIERARDRQHRQQLADRRGGQGNTFHGGGPPRGIGFAVRKLRFGRCGGRCRGARQRQRQQHDALVQAGVEPQRCQRRPHRRWRSVEARCRHRRRQCEDRGGRRTA